MGLRKLRVSEPVYWSNPLRDLEPRPFMGDVYWPDDPREPDWEEAAKALARFYCSDRVSGGTDPEQQLSSYLANPEKYLILWGEVGIGKSWFIRHELVAGEHSMATGSYHAGFIDMPASGGTAYGVYRWLKPILETYFERFCGSTEDALRSYSSYDLANLLAKPEDQLIGSDLDNVELSVRTWLKVRDEPSPEDTVSYVRRLLDALQHVDAPQLLILVPDNIDKTHDEDQERFVQVAVQLLRNPKIRLIIPLRRSSRLMRDRFSALREFSFQETDLYPLNMREMLLLRFRQSKDGRSLSGKPAADDPPLNGARYTFPQISTMLFGPDAKRVSASGDLLLTLAGSNAREALLLTERLIYSDQLKALRNIGNPEFAVAALMLPEHGVSPGVVNLFDNEEPGKPGNALVRFRVLEYFWNVKRATTSDQSFKRHFRRLGYELDMVKRVVELFVMTQLLVSLRGLSPEDISARPFDDIGTLELTECGERFQGLLRRMWYFVCAKRDVYLPEERIHTDKQGVEYCTHQDFIDWLREGEKREARATREYGRTVGPYRLEWGLMKPHEMAKAALRRFEEEDK